MLKITPAVAWPSHTTCESGWITCAEGFTVIVNVTGVPGHDIPGLVKVGVTTTVATIGVLPLLVAVNKGRLNPDTPINPIEGALLVQE